MPIVCLEGPSAVGKTTTALALAGEGAYVVPEVSAMVERPADESPEWYFERQVDRWRLAAEEARRRSLVVLDGDPFQPLWYGWAYDFVGRQGLDSLEAFYRPRLVQGEMGFPALYLVLGASVPTLRLRKEGDATRRRRGFEPHLRFILPQRRYFEAMRSFSPGRVRFLAARSVEETARSVSAAAEEATVEEKPVELFDSLVHWLRTHSAADE